MKTARLLLAALLTACVPAAPRRPTVDLAFMRARAARRPDDAQARRDRALAELVAPGGDLAFAERELPELPPDARVWFARGLLASQRGDFDGAFAAYVAAVRAARDVDDPAGGAVAEAAVPKIISLRGDVRDAATPLRALVDDVVTDPGHLGAAARAALLDSAVRWAREIGDRELAARWTEAAGCVTEWAVAGPFGPHPGLRFDDALPPESTGPLAAAYDVGPGRGRQPVYTIRARGCAANLGRGVTWTGVLFAAADVRVEADTEALVHVESPNVYSVIVDGVTVATVDPRRRATGSVANVPLRLVAGVHTLRVKIASGYHSPLLVATVTDRAGRPVARFVPPTASANPVPAEALRVRPSPVDDAYLAPTAAPLDPFSRYVHAELAFARRHPVAARELLRPLATAEGATATSLIAWASVALADPFLPSGAARDRARHAFEDAAARDPRAYYPALQLARLLNDEERADEALQQLREASRRFPDNAEVDAELADRLMQRNWDGEARALLARYRERLPAACWPSRMLLSLAQRRDDGAVESELSGEVRRCDALSDAAAATLSRLRRWGEAETEYLRLVEDDPEGRGLRRSLVELARARGDHAEAARRALALLADMPEDDALRADLADILLARGDADAARAALDRELALRPAQLASLFRMRAVLARRDDLEPWRLDGRRVLADFEASGRRYDGSAVLVLDYTVRRNYADGSALELTHNIIRVQSQEAVDEYGEFSLPAGATLYRIRTLKADGRVLEPERVAGKDTLSLPELRPGDAMEFEYVRALPPTDVSPGGFLGDRFYFRGFEVPYDRSEYVVVAPRGEELMVDPRGPAPTLERAERGGLVEHRWVAHQSHRMTPEPRAVASREFIPSVAVGSGATWDRFVEVLRERLLDQDVVDPEAQRLAREVTRGARTASERLRRVHGWVLDNIEQEGAGTPFDQAPRMLNARAGHRARVMCYLLRLSDVPCDLALVRPGNSDATRSPLADDDTYASILLRVRTERGVQWVTGADHNAPVSYVPPALAGGDALVLAPGAPRETIPALDLDAHGRTLTVRLALAADGSGRAVVEERLRGYAATGAREVVRRLDAANRERQFEAYVGGLVAGASLESLAITGGDDREQDMVFRYTFTAPDMARASDGSLAFEGLFHAEAGRVYAEVRERTVPLWNGDPIRATLDLTVSLPAGATVASLPPAAEGRAPGIAWSIAAERTADGFRLRRRVDIPTGRVTVADYARFAAEARALDTADTRRVTISTR
ncbi:MAG: hypothetical protein U0324_42330 [Polyangiales bacterium]